MWQNSRALLSKCLRSFCGSHSAWRDLTTLANSPRMKDLTRALPEIPDPDDCRAHPDDERELSHWLASEDGVQNEGNGNERKRDRSQQGCRAPAQAREIEVPEEHRQAPVKRRFPRSAANHRRDDMAMGIE